MMVADEWCVGAEYRLTHPTVLTLSLGGRGNRVGPDQVRGDVINSLSHSFRGRKGSGLLAFLWCPLANAAEGIYLV